MKNLSLLFVSLFVFVNIYSQDIKKNTVFLEVSGITGIYSINYERLLLKNRTFNLALRGGFAIMSGNISGSSHYDSRVIFPLSLSIIKNAYKNHFLEVRVGLTNSLFMYKDYSGRGLGDSTNNFVPTTKLKNTFIPSIGIGYRYQPEINGLFLNALVQKIVYFSEDNWYGNFSLGIGYVF